MRILLGCTYIFTIIIFYFTQRIVFKYNNGMILLTTIPLNEVDSIEVKSIIKDAKKTNLIVNIVFCLLGLIFFFNDNDLSIVLFLLMLLFYQAVVSFFLDKSVRQMRKLKKDKQFATFTRKYVDISLEKDMKSSYYGLIYWLIPFIIMVINYLIFGYEMVTFIFALGVAVFIIIGIVSRKIPLKIVSENRETNIYYNKLRIVKIQEKSFFFSCILAILSFVFTFVYKSDRYDFTTILLSLGVIAILQVYIVYYFSKIDNLLSQSIEEDKFVTDEDEYYDVWGYKNPNDNRIMILDRSSSAHYTINRGTKKGKLIMLLFNGIIALLILFSIYMIAGVNYNINFEKDRFSISAFVYSDEIKNGEIESVKILDGMPTDKIIRTNGTATKKMAYGNFEAKGLGKIRLYLYNDVKSVIEIKRKDKKTIYVNMKTEEKTKELFNKLDDIR